MQVYVCQSETQVYTTNAILFTVHSVRSRRDQTKVRVLADLDWLNDEAGKQVSGVDDGERLQQTGGGRTPLVPAATEHAERQHVADEADDTQRADDVHVDEQLVLTDCVQLLSVCVRRNLVNLLTYLLG